jgi:hypothetical protein
MIGFRGVKWIRSTAVLGSGAEVDWVEDVKKTKASSLRAEVAMAAHHLGSELRLMGIVLAGWSILWIT